MIEPIKEKGAPRAKVTCEDCGKEEVVPCGYLKDPHTKAHSPDEGQIIKKMNQSGWSYIKGKLRCSTCEAKRKVVPMKKPETKIEAPREPTRAEKREIMDLLETVYDVEAEHYKAGDTDETVADVLGVMPGWVAQIREEFFGPDGGNEDIERLEREVAEVRAEATQKLRASVAANDEVQKVIAKLSAIAATLEKIKKAVGPRALAKAGVK